MALSVRPLKGTTTRKLGRKKGTSRIPQLDIPFRAPFGSYDPALDAAERASGRGLSDLMEDIGRQNERDQNDYTTSLGDIGRSRDETIADLQARLDRSVGDIDRNRARATEDYQRNVTGLARQFSQLANRQSQQARQSGNVGATSGGVLAQALRKRTENQAIAKQPLDTGYQRTTADLDSQRQRIIDDVHTNAQRAIDAAGRQSGKLSLGLNRDLQDRLKVQGPRAQREYGQFQLDTQASRIAQVKQTTPSYFQDWLKQRKKAGLSNRRYS